MAHTVGTETLEVEGPAREPDPLEAGPAANAAGGGLIAAGTFSFWKTGVQLG